LRAPNLAAIIADGCIIRHVLRFERPDFQPAIACNATKTGNKHAFADIRTRSLKHDCACHASLPIPTSCDWQSPAVAATLYAKMRISLLQK
jgi:hypothetical protein